MDHFPIMRYDDRTKTYKCWHQGCMTEAKTAQAALEMVKDKLTKRRAYLELKLSGEELEQVRRAA